MAGINKQEIKNLIALEAQRQGVPVDLALALAKQESGFNPSVKSSAGAIGVMQLMPATAKSLGVNPNNIQENIRGGIAYLKQQLNKYNGNYELALAAYNAGPGAVDKAKGVPPYKETQNYVKNIMASVIPNQITGAAAPITSDVNDVGERLAGVQADYINAAQRGIAQYASQPYDPSLGLGLRGARVGESTDQLNRVVRETPMDLTPAQQQQLLNNFAAQTGALQNIYSDAANRIQSTTGVNAYAPYEQKLKDAYEAQISRLQAANPYTRMAQVAPMEQVDPEHIRALQDQKAVMDVYGRSLGLQPAYDWAALEQQKALTDRAIRMANATGLTPEEFIQGGLGDYNQMSAALNNQNQMLANIYQRAMLGDQQALQQIQGIAQNTQANIVSNQANAYKALNDAQKFQLEKAKANWDRRKAMLDYVGGLDPSMVQGASQIQGQNIGTAGNMYNVGLNAGVNAGKTLTGYETAFIPGTSGANGTEALTPQQQFLKLISPVSNYYSQSNDPAAMEKFNAVMGTGADYAGFDPNLSRIMFPRMDTNTFNTNQQ